MVMIMQDRDQQELVCMEPKEFEEYELMIKESKRLCDIIVNSPSDTIIKGQIEDMAFTLSHTILNK